METQQHSFLNKAGNFVLWRGLFLILFGIIALLWAGPTLWALVFVFGVFALVDGIILIVMYSRHRTVWGSASLWFGIVSILIGIYALLFPGLTALALALFIAVRAFIGGIFELNMAAQLRKHIANEALLILSGIFAMLFAVVFVLLLFLHPVFGLLVLVQVIGIYAIFIGIVLIILSLRLKRFGKKITTVS